MRVTKDANVRSSAIKKSSSSIRELAARIQNMPDGNPDPCELDDRLRLDTAPLISINIAGDRRYGSDVFQTLDNHRLADITSMNDMIGMLEMLRNCRIEQTMCVGNDSEADEARPAHGAEPDDTPSASRTLDHSNENGSDVCFGISASRALR